MGGRGSSTGGVGGTSVAGGGGAGSPVVAGGCGSVASGISLVLLGNGAYIVGGGSFVSGDEGTSCAGVSGVGRVVVAGALGPEPTEDRSGVISLTLPDHGILAPTAVRFSRTSRNTVSPSAPSSAAT